MKPKWYLVKSLYLGTHFVLGYSPMHALHRAIRRRKATRIGTAIVEVK